MVTHRNVIWEDVLMGTRCTDRVIHSSMTAARSLETLPFSIITSSYCPSSCPDMSDDAQAAIK